MNRPRDKFGNQETNAELRFVEVDEIKSDDNFPKPYQPVMVKGLRFADYEPAWTGAIEVENDDEPPVTVTVAVLTTKGGEKHGLAGNEIDVEFSIDGSLPVPVTASFNEDADKLSIKVKEAETTWKEVKEALSLVLDGAFTMTTTHLAESVGSAFGGVTRTLEGGGDGKYETYGKSFGIGGRDTKEDVAKGDRLWITRKHDAVRWEIVTGGGGADNEVVIALIDADIEGATEDAGQEQPNTDPAGDPLPLWALEPRQVTLKYFRAAQAARPMHKGSGTATGGGANTITLATDAIAVDDYYNGGKCTLSNGDNKKITGYVAATKVATVEANWPSGPPVASETTYAITKDDPGYKAPHSGTARGGGAKTITLATTASTTAKHYVGSTIRLTAGPGKGDERVITAYDGPTQVATVNRDWSAVPTIETQYDIPITRLILATKEVETSPGPPATYETQYETKEFWWLDGADITVGGDYGKAEYEETYGDLDASDPAFLSENDPFPPANSPEGYWKRRYRIDAVPDSSGRLWLDPKTCKAAPPPKLPPEG